MSLSLYFQCSESEIQKLSSRASRQNFGGAPQILPPPSGVGRVGRLLFKNIAAFEHPTITIAKLSLRFDNSIAILHSDHL